MINQPTTATEAYFDANQVAVWLRNVARVRRVEGEDPQVTLDKAAALRRVCAYLRTLEDVDTDLIEDDE